MTVLQRTIDTISCMNDEQIEQVYSFAVSLMTPSTVRDADELVYRQPGSMKGEIWMADDFDDTPDCFAEFI